MLSRIAESLFWIGRYIERADGTARILDVHLQLLLEDPWIEEDTACRSIMGVMGSVPPRDDVRVTRGDVLTSLAIDRTNPSSIAYAVQSARENARRAREIVSTELWETLNTTYSRTPRRINNEKAHEFFQWVRERSALAVGVTDSSTSRDEAWQFLTLGRAIERTDMTARLLATRALTEHPARPGRRSSAPAAPTRRICAPTAACRARPMRPSSCCSTGCSRGR